MPETQGKAKAVINEAQTVVVKAAAPKSKSKTLASAAAPAVKKSRKKTQEADVQFYESYDMHGETYSVGDDGERAMRRPINACNMATRVLV